MVKKRQSKQVAKTETVFNFDVNINPPAKSANLKAWLQKTNNKGLNAFEMIRVLEQLLPSLRNKARNKSESKKGASLFERVDKLKRLYNETISESVTLSGFKDSQEVYQEIVDLYQTAMNSQSLFRLTERFCEFVQRKSASHDDGHEHLSQK